MLNSVSIYALFVPVKTVSTVKSKNKFHEKNLIVIDFKMKKILSSLFNNKFWIVCIFTKSIFFNVKQTLAS